MHYLFHRSTAQLGPICYLQDMFTAKHARRRGVGRALIQGVCARAKSAGASRVYWIIHQSNTTARALYDQAAHGSNPLTGCDHAQPGHGGQEGENQLGDVIACHVDTHVNHAQADTAFLELGEHGGRIEALRNMRSSLGAMTTSSGFTPAAPLATHAQPTAWEPETPQSTNVRDTSRPREGIAATSRLPASFKPNGDDHDPDYLHPVDTRNRSSAEGVA